LAPGTNLDTAFSEHSALMVDFIEGTYRLEWPVSLLLPDVARVGPVIGYCVGMPKP